MSERLIEAARGMSDVTIAVAIIVFIGGWLPAIWMTFISGRAGGWLCADVFFWEGVSFVPLGTAIAFYTIGMIALSVEIQLRVRRPQHTRQRD